MKTARERLDILTTYAELGSYRATAALCGTTHKTVRRVVERGTDPPGERPPRPRVIQGIVRCRCRATDAGAVRVAMTKSPPMATKKSPPLDRS